MGSEIDQRLHLRTVRQNSHGCSGSLVAWGQIVRFSPVCGPRSTVIRLVAVNGCRGSKFSGRWDCFGGPVINPSLATSSRIFRDRVARGSPDRPPEPVRSQAHRQPDQGSDHWPAQVRELPDPTEAVWSVRDARYGLEYLHRPRSSHCGCLLGTKPPERSPGLRGTGLDLVHRAVATSTWYCHHGLSHH